MSAQKFWFRASPERLEQVIREIEAGANAGLNFFLLLTTATLIATLGLIANNTTLIIAAMLVCPLMTPMLGIAIGVIRGDLKLLRRSTQAEVVGITLEVSIAAAIAMLPLSIEVTPEMLNCTRPTLFDLLVALLAGFAGTYAMIDEQISPVLPGVAIATAIVPPLANTGICLALGAWLGAAGSFLLFLANFFAIILMAVITFLAAGVNPPPDWLQKGPVVRRCLATGVGFLLVTVLLTHTLVEITRSRQLARTIKAELASQFSNYPATSLIEAIHQQYEDKLYVLAAMRTPRVIPPDAVSRVQAVFTEKLGTSTELILRCGLARDVSATGSTSSVTGQNLDGFFLTSHVAPEVLKLQLAEQVLREILTKRPGLTLMDVDLVDLPVGPFVLASIQGPRALLPGEVQEMETAIQVRLADREIRLLSRFLRDQEIDRYGHILHGWSHFERQTPDEEAEIGRIAEVVRNSFEANAEVFVTNMDAMPEGQGWAVRVETSGSRATTPREAASLEKALSEQLKRPAKVTIWSKIEGLVTVAGYQPVDEFTRMHLSHH